MVPVSVLSVLNSFIFNPNSNNTSLPILQRKGLALRIGVSRAAVPFLVGWCLFGLGVAVLNLFLNSFVHSPPPDCHVNQCLHVIVVSLLVLGL